MLEFWNTVLSSVYWADRQWGEDCNCECGRSGVGGRYVWECCWRWPQWYEGWHRKGFTVSSYKKKIKKIKAVMPPFWQRCTLETWHMMSQPHPINWEEGILPDVYDPLITENTLCIHRTPSWCGTANEVGMCSSWIPRTINLEILW